MKLISISGRHHGGKTTIADHIVKCVGDRAVRINFADPIREVVFSMCPSWWGLESPEDLKSQDTKDRVLPSGKTVREALQMIGQVYREVDENYWVDIYNERLDQLEGTNMVVITEDMRFVNEFINNQQRYDCLTLRTTRRKDDSKDKSEADLDEIEKATVQMLNTGDVVTGQLYFDQIIFNESMDIDEANDKAMDYVSQHLTSDLKDYERLG